VVVLLMSHCRSELPHRMSFWHAPSGRALVEDTPGSKAPPVTPSAVQGSKRAPTRVVALDNIVMLPSAQDEAVPGLHRMRALQSRPARRNLFASTPKLLRTAPQEELEPRACWVQKATQDAAAALPDCPSACRTNGWACSKHSLQSSQPPPLIVQLPKESALQVSTPLLQVHSLVGLLAVVLSHVSAGAEQLLAVKHLPKGMLVLAAMPGTSIPPAAPVLLPCIVQRSNCRPLPQLLLLHWPRAKHRPAARLPRLPGTAPAVLMEVATAAHCVALARLLKDLCAGTIKHEEVLPIS